MTVFDQGRAPLFDAAKQYVADGVVPFHVPGHKHGRGLPEFTEYLGERTLRIDANGMEGLDYVNNPTSVIREAERLMAHAFGGQYAYFLVNGTTSGVQAMILSACEPGDKLILPRNAHKSAIGALILGGVLPVYMPPEVNERIGMAVNVGEEELKKAIRANPRAKAVFVVNPTYYGMACDLKSIVRVAHRHGMAVLVDEAHGAHMSFHNDFPLTAMEAGADMSAVSMHKTGGSMTQSSALLLRSNMISPERVRQVLNLTATSSASYVLMCSLDVARKQLATRGCDMLERALGLARRAREEINAIPDLYAFGRELVGQPGCHGFDETKLGVHVAGIGRTGYEVEKLLRRDYNIQIELSDLYNILAMVTLGDDKGNLDALVAALADIAQKSGGRQFGNPVRLPESPKMIVSPRDAFYSPTKSVPVAASAGEVAGEMVMAYPPGIPVVCMGERITQEIVDYILRLKEENCQLQGTADQGVEWIRVLGN